MKLVKKSRWRRQEQEQEPEQGPEKQQEEEQDNEGEEVDYNRPDAIAEKDYWRTRYGTNNNYDTDFGGMFYDENPFYNRYNNEDDYVEREEDLEDMRRRELRENARLRRMRADLDDREYGIDGYETPYQKVGIKSEKHRVQRNRRAIEGPLDDEIVYSDYNQLPVGQGYRSHAYEFGYSMIPPGEVVSTTP